MIKSPNTSSEKMLTISEAIDDLKKRGYSEELKLDEDCLACQSTGDQLQPQDFEVDESYRFEGDSNPSDEAVVYAISSARLGIKGILIDAYGAYAGPRSAELARKLRHTPRTKS